jgi:hypothetical protein
VDFIFATNVSIEIGWFSVFVARKRQVSLYMWDDQSRKERKGEQEQGGGAHMMFLG